VRDLPLATVLNGIIPVPNASEPGAAASLTYFRFFVPANTNQVSLSLQNTGGLFELCTVQGYVRINGLPCPEDPYTTMYSNQHLPCSDEVGLTYFSGTITLTPWGGEYFGIRFSTNVYWYVGVGFDVEVPGHACEFSLTATANICPNATGCANVTDWSQVVPQTPGSFTQALNDLPGPFQFAVEIPQNVARFQVLVNDTSSTGQSISLYAMCGVGFPSPWGSEYTTDAETSVTDSGSLTIDTPFAGLLYVNIIGENLGSVTTTYTYCTPPTTGPGCVGVLHTLNDLGPFTRETSFYDYWVMPPHTPNTYLLFNVTIESVVGANAVENPSILAFQPNAIASLGNLEIFQFKWSITDVAPAWVVLTLFPQDFVNNGTWSVLVYTTAGHNFTVAWEEIPFTVPFIQGASTSSTGGSTGGSVSSTGGSSGSSIPTTSGSGLPLTNSASTLLGAKGLMLVVMAIFLII